MFASLASGKVWLLSAVYFLNTNVTYGIFLWLPSMLADASGYRGLRLPLITAIPFAFALVAMVLVGRHSDRTGERKGHVAACALVAALGLIVVVWLPSERRAHRLRLRAVPDRAAIGDAAVLGDSADLPRRHRGRAGIALINAIGNLGGDVGPSVMGVLKDQTGGYSGGLLVLVAALLIEAVLVLLIRLPKPEPRST